MYSLSIKGILFGWNGSLQILSRKYKYKIYANKIVNAFHSPIKNTIKKLAENNIPNQVGQIPKQKKCID